MLVKQGKISVDEAMARIKNYEKQRNSCCEKKNKQVRSFILSYGLLVQCTNAPPNWEGWCWS